MNIKDKSYLIRTGWVITHKNHGNSKFVVIGCSNKSAHSEGSCTHAICTEADSTTDTVKGQDYLFVPDNCTVIEVPSDSRNVGRELEQWRRVGRALTDLLRVTGRDQIRKLNEQLDVEITRSRLLLDGELERAERLNKL